MTDEQIIKAYERCFTLGFDESTCYECPFYTATAKCTEDLRDSALALINRQKSENKEFRARISYLEKSIDCSRKEYNRLLQKLQHAQSEAIKEFAERLKSRLANLSVQTKTYGRKTMPNYVDDIANQILHDVVPQEIDNLVKEMTEE